MKTICALILASLMMTSAHAEPTMGTGIVCDTAEQIETILNAKDKLEAIQKINDEAKVLACGGASIVFEKGEEVKKVVDNKHDMYVIVEIQVLAGQTPYGFERLAAPVTQYTFFKIQGFGI